MLDEASKVADPFLPSLFMCLTMLFSEFLRAGSRRLTPRAGLQGSLLKALALPSSR